MLHPRERGRSKQNQLKMLRLQSLVGSTVVRLDAILLHALHQFGQVTNQKAEAE